MPYPSAADRADCLKAHNDARQSVPSYNKPAPLTYSTSLEASACAWSRYLANTGQFSHSGGKVGGYGENLWKSWGSYAQAVEQGSCREAVNSWAAEQKYYSAGQSIGSGNF
ncbi:hypothetical protein HK104_003218, partial [Borealophlyctis nickersoniae]